MSTSHAEFEDLCAAFAVGALDGAEREKLRAHLPTCSACRQRVAEFEESATWLALGLTPIAPSAQVKSAVMQRISGAHGKAPTPAGGGGPGLLTYVALGLAALALVSAGGMGVLYSRVSGELETRTQERDSLDAEKDLLEARVKDLERVRAKLAVAEEALARKSSDLAESEQARFDLARDYDAAMKELERLRRIAALLQDRDAEVISLKGNDPSIGQGRARVLWKDDHLAFVGVDLPPLPQGKTYELWSILPGGAPQPAGLFADLDPRGDTLGLHQLPGDPGQRPTFAVTIEAAAGTTTPTPPIVLISE